MLTDRRARGLEARSLVYEGDDADASKATHKHFGLIGNMFLLLLKRPGLSCRKDRIAKISQDSGVVAICGGATGSAKSDRVAHRLQHLAIIWAYGFSAHKIGQSITTVFRCGSSRHA